MLIGEMDLYRLLVPLPSGRERVPEGRVRVFPYVNPTAVRITSMNLMPMNGTMMPPRP
jgi:hypothetical protein